MPSPIAHSLVGLAAGKAIGAPSRTRPGLWYAFAVVFANIADLDFLPGLIIGDVNRFHHAASHSLIVAVVISALAGFVLGRNARSAVSFTLACVMLYISHLVLDYFSADNVPPYGMPLLWPFSEEYHMSSLTLFVGVKHGNPGDTISAFLQNIFSAYNLKALGLELLICAPVLGAGWFVGAFRRRRAAFGS